METDGRPIEHPPRTGHGRVARALAHRLATRARELMHHPVRLLIGGICIVLLAIALPLLIGGGTRLHSAWNDWRHDRTVGRDWVSSTATIREIRERGGLTLRVTYRDRAADLHEATVSVESTGGDWVESRTPIRYDPDHPGSIDLVGVDEARPVGTALVAGAASGAGIAALILAFATWRKRRVLEESGHPFTVLRVPLAISAIVLAAGIAAWAVGTVSLRGWTGVADRLGHQFSIVFGDMLGITVPLVAFAIGCLLTAWLARHRHHEDHDGHAVARAPAHRPRRGLRPVARGAAGPAARVRSRDARRADPTDLEPDLVPAPEPGRDAGDEVRTGR